jgi:small subunit ribosomal protein S4
MKGMTGENLMILLERRLDNVVFRLGFARTRREARQMVDHKAFSVNGRTINIPSYSVKPGDIVEIREKVRSSQHIKDIFDTTADRTVPAWLTAEPENYKGTVSELPSREQIDVPVDELAIVELYSK